MTVFGDLDGHFDFYAVVTPDGRIPTVGEDMTLNDPSGWYTGPIGTLAHLSDYALVFTDRDDAEDDLLLCRGDLPEGTDIRVFSVEVVEFEDPGAARPSRLETAGRSGRIGVGHPRAGSSHGSDLASPYGGRRGPGGRPACPPQLRVPVQLLQHGGLDRLDQVLVEALLLRPAPVLRLARPPAEKGRGQTGKQ
jgi:hypothetical protein